MRKESPSPSRDKPTVSEPSRPIREVGQDGKAERGERVREQPPRSEPLFVVDNSEDGRNGLGYLREWCELAHALDVATGMFEIGSLVALDGAWQKLDKIRILMGTDVTLATKQAILKAIRSRAEHDLDASLD